MQGSIHYFTVPYCTALYCTVSLCTATPGLPGRWPAAAAAPDPGGGRAAPKGQHFLSGVYIRDIYIYMYTYRVFTKGLLGCM